MVHAKGQEDNLRMAVISVSTTNYKYQRAIGKRISKVINFEKPTWWPLTK